MLVSTKTRAVALSALMATFLATAGSGLASTTVGAGRIESWKGVQVTGLPDTACTSNATDFEDMPGMALRFVQRNRGPVVVTFQGQFGAGTSTPGARAVLRFTIDGVIVGSAIAIGNDHGTGLQTFGFNAFSQPLGTGVHELKALWHTFPSGATSCVEERSLIVLRP